MIRYTIVDGFDDKVIEPELTFDTKQEAIAECKEMNNCIVDDNPFMVAKNNYSRNLLDRVL